MRIRNINLNVPPAYATGLLFFQVSRQIMIKIKKRGFYEPGTVKNNTFLCATKKKKKKRVQRRGSGRKRQPS